MSFFYPFLVLSSIVFPLLTHSDLHALLYLFPMSFSFGTGSSASSPLLFFCLFSSYRLFSRLLPSLTHSHMLPRFPFLWLLCYWFCWFSSFLFRLLFTHGSPLSSPPHSLTPLTRLLLELTRTHQRGRRGWLFLRARIVASWSIYREASSVSFLSLSLLLALRSRSRPPPLSVILFLLFLDFLSFSPTLLSCPPPLPIFFSPMAFLSLVYRFPRYY